MANVFASSLNQAVTLLKTQFEGPIVTQFNDDMPFYRECEKGKEKWSGLKVNRSVKVRRNPGIGATSDGGLLPKIGAQTTIQAEIAAKYNYLRFGVTAPMIKASQGDKAAFASVMEYEMEQGLIDLKNDVARQQFWDGTADLAVVSANAVATNVISVTGRESNEDGDKYLDVGMVIDIYTSAGVLVQSGLTINSKSSGATASLTLDQNVTCSSTDIVVKSGSYGNEMQGILTSLDGGTSTIYAVDRSAYPIFGGNVVNAAAGQLTLNLMKQAHNAARLKGTGKINLM